MTTLPGWSPCCAPCCNVITSIVDISGGRLLAPENLAELRTITAYVDNGALPVRGHTTENDGGGGIWIFDAQSVQADDNAYIVKPNNITSGAGRWKRL